MVFDKSSLLLYAVTDRSWTGRQTLEEQIEEALLGGATCIQLREKNLDEEAFIREAAEIKCLCGRYGAPLIINDNVKVALESGADGVHVGQEDCPAGEIRKIAGKDFIIGVTAKTVLQAKKAEADGADYLGTGAMFPSPTKKNAIRITNKELKEITSSVSIPVVAIGGITEYNVSELAGCGICGVAVVSAVFAAENIKETTEKLKEKVCSIVKGDK